MGEVFHQRYNVIVNEELRAKIAEYKGKEPKNVTEQDVNDYINALSVVKE